MASGKKLVLRRRPMTGLASSAVTVSRRAFLGLASLGTSILSLAGARTAAAQRKTTPAAAIDVHAHFFPEKFLKSLAEGGGPPALQVEFSASGVPTLVRGTVRLALDVADWDLDKRIERMNGQNVTMHALSLTVPMVHWAPPERGAQLAQLVNDAMAEAHTAFPDRFVGCATLPVQDPALALKELERVAGGRAIRASPSFSPTPAGRCRTSGVGSSTARPFVRRPRTRRSGPSASICAGSTTTRSFTRRSSSGSSSGWWEPIASCSAVTTASTWDTNGRGTSS